MYTYEHTEDNKEQQLWEDMLSFGSQVLIDQMPCDAPIRYLDSVETEKANFCLDKAGMVPAERIGVGFTSSAEGPITLHSPDLTPYVMLFSPDEAVLSFSLASTMRGLLLHKEVLAAFDGKERTDAPDREALQGLDKFVIKSRFEQLVANNDAKHATAAERDTLLSIFEKLV